MRLESERRGRQHLEDRSLYSSSSGLNELGLSVCPPHAVVDNLKLKKVETRNALVQRSAGRAEGSETFFNEVHLTDFTSLPYFDDVRPSSYF